MHIHLHLGAHKTATTYLQSTLATNLARLNELGIGYLPLDPFRRTITERLNVLAARHARIEEFLPLFFANAALASPDRIIMSDENLIGHCPEITDNGVPFGNSVQRLKMLHDLLAGHRVTLFFAMRSYDTFIASAYCEALRGAHQFIEFPTVKARLKTDQFDWAGLVERFREVLAPHAVRIWRFEDFRSDPLKVLRQMAFDYDGEIAPADQWSVRQSFSQQAMDMLHNLARTAGISVATQMQKSLTDKMSKKAGFPDYYPWNTRERDYWTRKYAEDCQRIDKSLWLIPPPEVISANS